jgi:hypothetical protein
LPERVISGSVRGREHVRPGPESGGYGVGFPVEDGVFVRVASGQTPYESVPASTLNPTVWRYWMNEQMSILEVWRRFGQERIPENASVFSNLVSRTTEYARRQEFDMAAVFGSIAAFHASVRHCGIWASAALENCLLDVGRRAIPPTFDRNSRVVTPPARRHVLHVVSAVAPVGGLSRMLWRWINEDRDSTHSIVLTMQGHTEVPAFLRTIVPERGGQIHHLDNAIGGLIARAKLLRSLATNVSVIVLHIHPDDVVPVIAFAHKDGRPPIIFLDHADHSFWLAGSITTVYGSMRDSGRRLAETRRGIEQKRVAPLPTILEPRQREISRDEAKRRLRLPPDSTLLLSVARQRKFRTVGDVSYAHAHLPILQTYPHAILMVVGAGAQPDWPDAISVARGRIMAIDEIEEPGIYFQAADIYVDSFPFTSITSLLEAGSLSVPLVSRYPYSDQCGVLGSDMPGLAEVLYRAPSLELYNERLSRLIENESERLRLGEETRTRIIREHTGATWRRSLEHAYRLAIELPPADELPETVDAMSMGEPDIYVQSIHGGDPDAGRDTDRLIQGHLGLMPLRHRLRFWTEFVKARRFRNLGKYGRIAHLFPRWFLYRAGRYRRNMVAALR